MGLFKNREGGLMDVIRCDQKEYLVWKWRPEGQDLDSTRTENSIRYGSALRVKEGEVAVFFYKTQKGIQQEFLVGPYDGTITTANLPILTSIVGLAYGHETPFQAEIYFINLSGVNQVKFAIPYFDVFDPRFLDYAVPMAVRGNITFNITDYESFIKLHRLINFELDDFLKQIKDAVTKYVKSVIANIPSQYGIPVIQIEKKILDINDMIHSYLKPRLENDFGVNLQSIDISSIEADKGSLGYCSLMQITKQQTAKTIEAQTDVNIKNMFDTQRINAENMQESLAIQREEYQRAQRLQTESSFINAHTIDKHAEVLTAAANSLDEMGSVNIGGDGNTMNPASMMMGMAIGGVMGGQMGNMMGNMMNQMGQQIVPPPISGNNIAYMIVVNGQQSGPYNMQQLQQLVQSGQVTSQTYVWKQGMSNWEFASNVPELAGLFASGMTPPPIPTMP